MLRDIVKLAALSLLSLVGVTLLLHTMASHGL